MKNDTSQLHLSGLRKFFLTGNPVSKSALRNFYRQFDPLLKEQTFRNKITCQNGSCAKVFVDKARQFTQLSTSIKIKSCRKTFYRNAHIGIDEIPASFSRKLARSFR